MRINFKSFEGHWRGGHARNLNPRHHEDREVIATPGLGLLDDFVAGRWRNRSTRFITKALFKAMSDIGLKPERYSTQEAIDWLNRKEGSRR